MADPDRDRFDRELNRFNKTGMWGGALFAPVVVLAAAGVDTPLILGYGAVASVVLIAVVMRP